MIFFPQEMLGSLIKTHWFDLTGRILTSSEFTARSMNYSQPFNFLHRAFTFCQFKRSEEGAPFGLLRNKGLMVQEAENKNVLALPPGHYVIG